MINTGMMSSNISEWETPRDLFNTLNNEFNFDLDPASSDTNALCDVHYTIDQDGLTTPWVDHRTYVNPPYGRAISLWTAKAVRDIIVSYKGVTAMLLPCRTDTAWAHDYIFPYASEIRFIRGRLKFTLNNQPIGTAPFPSMIVIFDPRTLGARKITRITASGLIIPD